MEKDIIIDKLKKDCFRINDYMTHEVNCLQAIIDGSQEEREMFKRKIRQIKAILRTPRLTRLYT